MTSTTSGFGGEPVQPRKLPQQRRSVLLVEALKTACLRILADEGKEGLSAARLVEVSGVATASIYEYFPNLEALVAQVLREAAQQFHATPGASAMALPGDAPLRDVLEHLVRRTFEKRSYLVGLHRQVYLRHTAYFESVEVSDIEKLLERHAHQIEVHDLRIAALVVTGVLQQTTRSLLHEDLLETMPQQTQQMLVRMLHAALAPANPESTGAGPARA
ncbi:TetR/AcrR family transcriptional regulator [Massilia putida]|uniref:TetR/AcrR family transcriptional regulator n=1 Tax=Massilia putida TaxID=1141883 RepID=UPI0009515AF3|nr:TetR/AcrR family transcriptional regulator [Massilia putida]